MSSKKKIQRRLFVVFRDGNNGNGVNVGASSSSSTGVMLGQASNNLAEGQLELEQQQHPEQKHEKNQKNEELSRNDEKISEDNDKCNNDNNNEEDYDSNNDDKDQHHHKRKRHHRHTQPQIQEMEVFFKECPHPDDKQRKEMSRKLGLEPLQIKFWFQNKRTQMKTQHERLENSQLRNEIEKIRVENSRFREALSNATCPTCGGNTAIGDMSFDEHQLRLENTKLKEEIDHISTLANNYVRKPVSTYSYLSPVPVVPVATECIYEFGSSSNRTGFRKVLQISDDSNKPHIIELAFFAMKELMALTQLPEPLWFQSIDRTTKQLSNEKYVSAFTQGHGPKPFGYKTEASKETIDVKMDHMTIIKMLMDVNQWASVFSSIVSRASVIDVISSGVDRTFNGTLQVMSAEFQLPSPLVPTRDSCFARYCKHHGDGLWAVVDISLDSIFRASSQLRYCRRASGCLIQESPHGCSKVTWIEQAEVDDRGVHNIYKPLVNAGLAFSAKHWVYTLERQCARLSSLDTDLPTNMVFGGQEGRKRLLKLAERMVLRFSSVVGASTPYLWTTITENGQDEIRVMRKSMDEPGKPPGMVLNAATSFWHPAPPTKIFDLLRDLTRRYKWDILTNSLNVETISRIVNGTDPRNCVSLFHVNSEHRSQSDHLILQETCTDPTASFVVYAPVRVDDMNALFSGGNPKNVALLPNGFAILPDGLRELVGGNGEPVNGGSLVTVAMQILVDMTLGVESVGTVINLVNNTITRIKSSLTQDSI